MSNELENQQLDPTNKGVQWYFHPIEKIRMLRYFQLNMKFDNTDDYTVNYNNSPTIGVVIETTGNISYTELQLHFLKNINHISNILIYDNCLNNKSQLEQMSKDYNVDLYITQNKLYNNPTIGNLSNIDCIYQGLLWANSKNIDILVKLNDTLIPYYNWTEHLIQLAIESNASTFNSYCEKDQENFRIDCIGLNVNIWTKSYPLQSLLWTIENQYIVYPQFWLHELCKTLSGNNYSQKWKEYCNNYNAGYLHSGYAVWQDILGINKYTNKNRNEKVLYHLYSKKEDYLNISKILFGNKYILQDFNV